MALTAQYHSEFKDLFCKLIQTQTDVQNEITTTHDLLNETSESTQTDDSTYVAIKQKVKKLEEKYEDIKQENEALTSMKRSRRSKTSLNKTHPLCKSCSLSKTRLSKASSSSLSKSSSFSKTSIRTAPFCARPSSSISRRLSSLSKTPKRKSSTHLAKVSSGYLPSQTLQEAKNSFLKCEDKLSQGITNMKKSLSAMTIKNKILIMNLNCNLRTIEKLREENSLVHDLSIIDQYEDDKFTSASGDASSPDDLMNTSNNNVYNSSLFTPDNYSFELEAAGDGIITGSNLDAVTKDLQTKGSNLTKDQEFTGSNPCAPNDPDANQQISQSFMNDFKKWLESIPQTKGAEMNISDIKTSTPIATPEAFRYQSSNSSTGQLTPEYTLCKSPSISDMNTAGHLEMLSDDEDGDNEDMAHLSRSKSFSIDTSESEYESTVEVMPILNVPEEKYEEATFSYYCVSGSAVAAILCGLSVLGCVYYYKTTAGNR